MKLSEVEKILAVMIMSVVAMFFFALLPARAADAPAAQAAPQDQGEPVDTDHTTVAILVAVERQPKVVIFVSDKGDILPVSWDACKADDECAALFIKLHDAHRVLPISLKGAGTQVVWR